MTDQTTQSEGEVLVQLHDHGDKTRMTLSGGPYGPELLANAEAGMSGQLDKLERLLG
jgi:hypothetical protein